jgi:hypothetical protein
MGVSLTDAGSLQVSFLAGPAGLAYSVAHAFSWVGVNVTFDTHSQSPSAGMLAVGSA